MTFFKCVYLLFSKVIFDEFHNFFVRNRINFLGASSATHRA